MMDQKLFTNSVTINQPATIIKATLKDINALINWNPAITNVKTEDGAIFIYRNENSISPFEKISISEINNQITFTSTEETIEYQLMFTIDEFDDYSNLTENFYYFDSSKLKLPLKLMTPIVKHAFNQNLNTLKNIINYKSKKTWFKNQVFLFT